MHGFKKRNNNLLIPGCSFFTDVVRLRQSRVGLEVMNRYYSVWCARSWRSYPFKRWSHTILTMQVLQEGEWLGFPKFLATTLCSLFCLLYVAYSGFCCFYWNVEVPHPLSPPSGSEDHWSSNNDMVRSLQSLPLFIKLALRILYLGASHRRNT